MSKKTNRLKSIFLSTVTSVGRMKIAVRFALLAMLLPSSVEVAVAYPSEASSEEREALDALASEIEGAMIYTRRGRIKKITIGEWKVVDLGEGDYVRWGPLGKRIAVLHDEAIFVMNADGSDRRELVSRDVDGGDGCQMEFHTNGREILYCTDDEEVWAVDIFNGEKRDLDLPFETELNISADGKHLVGRNGDCYHITLPGTRVREFAGGCSPCVSPDGTRMTSNKGGHREMDIRSWSGEKLFEINTRNMRPDRKWDNMHWSNHNDFIAMQGDDDDDEAYAFRISENKGIRLSWEGRTKYPDLYVSKDLRTGEIPMESTLAWTETNGGETRVSVANHVRMESSASSDKDEGFIGGLVSMVRSLTGDSKEEEKSRNVESRDFSKFTSWPGDQSDLVFLWENNKATNQIVNTDSNSGRLCRAVVKGRAVFGPHYEMDLSGGSVVAQDVDDVLLEACKNSNELTIEATITPRGSTRNPASIVSFSRDSRSRNFELSQEGSSLVLNLRTTGAGGRSKVVLGKLKMGRPQHVVVSYRSGQLACFFDGKQTLNTDRVTGEFSNWNRMHLLFGDDWAGGRDWNGTAEGIAIYARAASAAEVSHKHRLYAERLTGRRSLDRLLVQGKLVEITPTPAVEDLQEYSRGIVIYSYEVLDVLKGKEPSKKIQVAHWAILDRQILPEIEQRKIGEVYQLHLENFDQHPQLESERSFNDSEEFDLPLYYDIASRDISKSSMLAGGTQSRRSAGSPRIHLKVNCGGPSLSDWESDEKYVDRRKDGDEYKFKRTADLSQVVDPAPLDVYRTVRHREHRYDFNVPNGEYLVRMHFFDENDSDGDKRKMDFIIENQVALKRFNIVSAAGSRRNAVVREIVVNVADGNGLQIIGEEPRGGDVFAAGIEILSM